MFQAQRRIFSAFKRHKAVSAENLYRHLPFEESNRERVDVARACGISGRTGSGRKRGEPKEGAEVGEDGLIFQKDFL